MALDISEGAGAAWLIDAQGCDPAALRSITALARLFARAIDDLQLHPLREPSWHVFPEPGGITGFVLLSESHLCCHTFPESGFATIDLYCCRPRPEWPWAQQLRDHLGAREVFIQRVDRGSRLPRSDISSTLNTVAR